MTDSTTTTTTTAPVALKKVPKQWMLGCSKDDKDEIVSIASEFIGEGLTKSYAMTEKEVINMLLNFATSRRFEEQIVTSDGGEENIEVVDHFQIEAKRVFALRDTKPTKVDNNSPEALQREMARITARLAELGLSK